MWSAWSKQLLQVNTHHGLAGSGAKTGDEVEHAGREASLDNVLADLERGERGRLGRLEDDRVAGREGGRNLPSKHGSGEVPAGNEYESGYLRLTG
jgi:hypothetical protein